MTGEPCSPRCNWPDAVTSSPLASAPCRPAYLSSTTTTRSSTTWSNTWANSVRNPSCGAMTPSSLDEVGALGVSGALISPGPGRPEDAGVSVALVRRFAGQFPILGVCLGHQAVGYAFGANVGRAAQLLHGKTSQVSHDGRGIFAGLASPFTATRYHSLVVERDTLGNELEVSAWAEDGTVMGYPAQGPPGRRGPVPSRGGADGRRASAVGQLAGVVRAAGCGGGGAGELAVGYPRPPGLSLGSPCPRRAAANQHFSACVAPTFARQHALRADCRAKVDVPTCLGPPARPVPKAKSASKAKSAPKASAV